jgi:hypothetical protein
MSPKGADALKHQEDILIEYIAEFGACVEVEELFRRNFPTEPPPHAAGEIVLWTSARSYRTFKVMVEVCRLGYALEAAKLNRPLFEDMVAAHWATQFPEKSNKLILDHGRYAEVLRSEFYAKHRLSYPRADVPELTPQERETFDARYQHGSRPWTGKSVSEMVTNIVAQWPTEYRRHLMQMHDIAHRANNVILHHSAHSLSGGVVETEQGYRFDVRPSKVGVGSALVFGFWTFGNTISLVLTEDILDKLNEIMSRYSHLFSKVRSAGEPE